MINLLEMIWQEREISREIYHCIRGKVMRRLSEKPAVESVLKKTVAERAFLSENI